MKNEIVQLRLESTNLEDSLSTVRQQYRSAAGAQVGGVKTRTALTVLRKIYCGGCSARLGTQEGLRPLELQGASVAKEVNLLAMELDRMMSAGEHDALAESPAGELTCLSPYAIGEAYEWMQCRSDWQLPKV